MNLLVVYGYHPKEIFSVEVGKYILENNPIPEELGVVKYNGNEENLDKFILLIWVSFVLFTTP